MEPMPKPSLEQMLETIPQQMLDEKVRDIHLEDIARELVDWKSVCTTLGISETEEAAIEEENRTAHLRRLAVLRMWRSKYGPNATYGNLATRLYSADKLEVVEAVCQALRTPRVNGNLHENQFVNTMSSPNGTDIANTEPRVTGIDAASPYHETTSQQNFAARNTHRSIYSEVVANSPLVKYSQGLEDELIEQTHKIQDEFNNLFTKVHLFLDSKKVTVQALVLFLENVPGYGRNSLFQTEISDLHKASNLGDVFQIARTRCSWFNHSLVRSLIKTFCSDNKEIKRVYKNYLAHLQKYCKHRVKKFPSNNRFGFGGKQDEKMIMKVDRKWEEIRIEELEEVLFNLAHILDVPRHTLHLYSVENGCVQLTIAVPSCIPNKIFPLTTEQVAAMGKMDVISLQCGSYHFSCQATLQSSVKYSVESETDPVPHKELIVPSFSSGLESSMTSKTGPGPHGRGGGGGESTIDHLVHVCQAGCKEGLEKILKEHDTEILLTKNKEGTTPLHEACCYGNIECIHVLLKHEACVNMWDMRGFTPIHSAAYNGQKEAIKLLLDFQSRDIDVDVDCLSRYEETPLHIACLRGNVEVADYLEWKGADIGAVDKDGNTVLHYGSSSNSQSLMEWLLRRPGVREKINMKNKLGHTPAHRAVILGCPNSVSVLLTNGADFSITDSKGHSALKLAELLNNIQCYRNATRPTSRRDHTLAPTSSQSGENLPALNPPQLQPQRSHRSFQSLHEAERSPRGSPRSLRQRPSITGTTRPVNLSVPKRVLSLRQASLVRRASSLSYHSEERANIYLSKEAMSRLSRNLEHQDSLGWEDTSQMLYNNTAYEPPPDIMFIPPITKETLTFNNPHVHCQTHDLKLRLSKNYWDKNKEEGVEVCLCAAMHLNCSFSEGYTIVSPVCFVSLKSRRPCEVDITLPHAIANVETVKEKICILSMTTIDPNLKPDSPLSSPTECILVYLQGIEPQAEKRSVKFKTSLACPSLFVVAVRDRPPDLRCSLLVIYPELDPGSSVTGFDVEAYIGMNLKTVTTAVARKERCRVEEAQHFVLTSGSQLEVRGSLTNPITDWEIEPRGRGDLRYTQVALTQDTDSDAYTSYSHRLVYPPCKRFFIEPKAAASAIKCNITVIDSQRELCRLLVVPFAPTHTYAPSHALSIKHRSSWLLGDLRDRCLETRDLLESLI